MVFSREAGPLKIATFNINNINKRLANLLAWLGEGPFRRMRRIGLDGPRPLPFWRGPLAGRPGWHMTYLEQTSK